MPTTHSHSPHQLITSISPSRSSNNFAAMPSFALKSFAARALASIVIASPYPYGQLAERSELSEADAAKFFAACAEGSAAVEGMMHSSEIQKREFTEQEKFYKCQLDLSEHLLGGG